MTAKHEDKHSPQTPDLPNASIDFNKLHAAAIAGKLDKGIPDAAIVIGEQGGMLTDASDEIDVQANIDAATPAERAAMKAAGTTLKPTAE